MEKYLRVNWLVIEITSSMAHIGVVSDEYTFCSQQNKRGEFWVRMLRQQQVLVIPAGYKGHQSSIYRDGVSLRIPEEDSFTSMWKHDPAKEDARLKPSR